MAIAFNSSQDGTSTASTITTPQLGFAIAADLYPAVGIGPRPNTSTVTSVGDALGRSYTQRARVTHATSQTLAVEVWTSDTPSTALSDGWFASATMSGSPTKSGIVALNYSGVGSIGSTFPTATGAAGSNPSVSLTPTATTSYAVMGACVSGVGTFAANTGTLRETIQTTGGSGGSNHCTLGNDRTGVTPEVNTVTATSAGHWAAAAVELKVPSGLTEGTGAAAGIGALTSLAAALWNSLASAAGVGTPTAVGRWFSLAVVSSAGTATPTATAATVLADPAPRRAPARPRVPPRRAGRRWRAQPAWARSPAPHLPLARPPAARPVSAHRPPAVRSPPARSLRRPGAAQRPATASPSARSRPPEPRPGPVPRAPPARYRGRAAGRPAEPAPRQRPARCPSPP